MIILASTTEVLRARLAAAVATSQPTFSSAWGDSASSPVLGNTRGALNGTTNVNLVGSPAASTQRVVKGVYVYNADTASVTLTIEHYDGTNAYAIAVVTLPPGYTLCLDDQGLQVTSSVGEILSGSGGTVSSVGLAMPAIFTVSGSPVTTTGTLTAALATENANLIFAGPSSGGAAAPTFRAQVLADLPSGVAQLASANVFTQQQAVTPYRANISGAVTIDLAATAKSNNLHLTLTGNVTSFALTNPVDGAVYNFRFIQDATGGRTFSGFPSAFKFSGGTAPTFSTAANAVDFMSAEYGSTEATYMASFLKGMA